MEIESTVSGEGIRLELAQRTDVPYPDYHYHILSAGRKVGDIHLRLGSYRQLCYAGNIGYYIYPAHRGQGIAPAACRLLARERRDWALPAWSLPPTRRIILRAGCARSWAPCCWRRCASRPPILSTCRGSGKSAAICGRWGMRPFCL